MYLHYNSGLHISINGHLLAQRLELLLDQWPQPVQRLVLLGHSMGGLLARSAQHYATQAGLGWTQCLSDMVFLGTPHHGAPLERAGNWIDAALGATPYAAPFARLGRIRSAGITDLRHGNALDEDWEHRDRHAQKQDDRVPTPLPEGVQCYLVAATRAKKTTGMRSIVVSDGLVPLASALGKHRDPAFALNVPKSHRLVVTAAGHWDLLSRADVYAKLCVWLA